MRKLLKSYFTINNTTPLMKHCILLVATWLLLITSQAQTILKGTVTSKNKQAVAGASISIKNSYDGAVADSLGRFQFIHEIQSNDTIEITASGYTSVIKRLDSWQNLSALHVQLTEEISELNAVVVRSAGAFLAGGDKKGVIMSALDIVTTAQNGDVTSALRMLPGAQQVGEQEGLFVRGGTAQETKQYMDGAIIKNPFFRGAENFAQRGRYNPFLFSGTLFSTGAYSALYGDALSSVVLLTTVDLPERPEMMLTISPIMIEAGTQQVAKNKTHSWGATYRHTNISPYFGLFNTLPEFYSGPRFHVGDANFRIKTRWGGMLKFFAAYSYNKVGIRTADIDSSYLKDQTLVANNNLYTNFNWQENLGNRWKMIWSNSFSTNKDDIKASVVDSHHVVRLFDNSTFWMNAKNFAVINRDQNLQSRYVLEKRLRQLNTLRAGAEYNFFRNEVDLNSQHYSLNDHATAMFAEMDYYASNKLGATLGARAEYASVIGKGNIVPRASVAYKLGKGQQASFSYGIFFQKPDAMFLLRNRNLDYTRATHYLLNYTRAGAGQILRLEAYYKDYNQLIKTIPLSATNFTYDNSGDGYAGGLDVFWKDKATFKAFEYWLSYSYLNTRRNYLNYAETLQPHYATPHTFSVVAKKFVLPIKTQFNLTYSFATGRPYYFFQQSGNDFQLKDQGKTINYNNVGFSVNYVPYIGKESKKTHVIVVATVSNLLNTKQIYGYTYSYNGLTKQPVLPATRQFIFLGVFLNIGTDRTQQIINDNL